MLLYYFDYHKVSCFTKKTDFVKLLTYISSPKTYRMEFETYSDDTELMRREKKWISCL